MVAVSSAKSPSVFPSLGVVRQASSVPTIKGPEYIFVVSDCRFPSTYHAKLSVTGSPSASELDTTQVTELVLTSMVLGESATESMTGGVLVIVWVAVSEEVPPERSVAVAVQSMVSPSTPIEESNVSGFEVPREPEALNHS